MSYPRAIQPLVIEDEQDAKAYYEEVFQQFVGAHRVLPPRFAFCQSDALEQLSQDLVFHLIILDLRLPENPGQPPSSSLDLGQTILQTCLSRNSYPIPAMLVISGNLQHANQHDLEQQVRNGFEYGRVLVKSERLKHEIEEAILHCERYCDAGIHLRDSGNKVFPTLSPRDIDLLRRCILYEHCLGVDVGWWSVDFSPFSGWTKVLLGRFVLDEGRGQSLYTFFKLTSSEGATTVFREAEVMKQQLKHIKVVHAQAAGDRSLLVTQAAGSGVVPPLSLDDVIGRPHASVTNALGTVATTIAQQLAALGDRSPDQCVVSKLLWDHHDLTRLQDQWERRGGEQILTELGSVETSCPNPIDVLKHLQSSTATIRYQKQSCRHGDLNYTNIALDETTEGDFDAYIFDASGCTAGASVRDLGMLEVTTLLHQPSHGGRSIVKRCSSLYGARDDDHEGEQSEVDDQVANVLEFVASIREQALLLDEQNIYALMVFDNALMQLGGLGFGSSFNKIQDPKDAVLLAALSCQWLVSVFSDLAQEFNQRFRAPESGDG